MSVIEAEPIEAETPVERELVENADRRTQLRRQSNRAQVKLALGDLAEALRGFIRAAPLTAVATAAGVGALIATRKRRRPIARRRA